LTQLKALEEIVDLAIEDPIIRQVLRESRLSKLSPKYGEFNLLMSTSRAICSISDTETHSLWSPLVLRDAFEGFYCMESNGQFNRPPSGLEESLKNSLTHPASSFVAARYFLRAVEQCRWDAGVQFLHSLWKCYLGVATSNPSFIEWSNIDRCAGIFTQDHYSTYSIYIDTTITSIAFKSLVRLPDAQNLISTLTTLFAIPKLKFRILEVDGCSTYNFDRCNTVSFEYLDEEIPFYINYLTTFTGFEQMRPQMSYLHNFFGTKRHVLSNTVLLDEKAIAYCHLVFKHTPIRVNTLYFDRGPSMESWDSTLCGTAVLASYFDVLTDTEDRALAICLAAKSIGKSRYNRFALDIATQALTPPIPSQVFNNLYEISREDGLLRGEDLHQRKLHLSRFGAGGSYHITCNFRRRKPAKVDGRSYVPVDTMVIQEDDIMFIDVDGLQSPFASTGHRPVVVCRDTLGNARYVALVVHDGNYGQECFTCIMEGASTVTYEYGGRTHVTHKFSVMVLRHDPMYLYPPYPRRPDDAVDPTGYLFWERSFVSQNVFRKCGLGQELFDEFSMQTNTNEERESWFEGGDPESSDGFWGSSDEGEESSSEYGDSQSEEEMEDSDDRVDSSEGAIGPTPLLSNVTDTARSDESTSDAGTRSSSGVRSGVRHICSTQHFEESETSGSNDNSQQLAEKLARAEEEIALLKLENERLRARM